MLSLRSDGERTTCPAQMETPRPRKRFAVIAAAAVLGVSSLTYLVRRLIIPPPALLSGSDSCATRGTLGDVQAAPLRDKAASFRDQVAQVAKNGGAAPLLDSSATGFEYTPLASRYLNLLAGALLGTLFSEQIGSCGGGSSVCALANLLPFDSQARLGGNDWPPVVTQ